MDVRNKEMNKGLTLLECLLLILIIGLSAILITPRVQSYRLNANATELMYRGRNIHVLFFAYDSYDTDMNNWKFQESVLKNTTIHYRTSTEVFSDMVRKEFISNTSYNFFGGGGVPECTSTNHQDFTSFNNAWCLTANGASITNSRTPFLFTRNVELNALGPLSRPSLSTNAPFGKKLWVVISRSGSALSLDGDYIDVWYTGAEFISVLRP